MRKSLSLIERAHRRASTTGVFPHGLPACASLLLAALLGCGGSPTTPPQAPASHNSSDAADEPLVGSDAVDALPAHPSHVDDPPADASRVGEPQNDVPSDETHALVADPVRTPVTAARPSRLLHGGACTVETRTIGRVSARRLPLGLAVGPAGGVAVYRSAPGRLTSQRLDATGLPVGDAQTVEVPHLRYISFVHSDSEGTDVFGVADACGHQGSGCVVTVSLDANGQLRAEPLVQVIPGGQWLELEHHTQVDGTTFAEVKNRWGNGVVRFDRNALGQLAMQRVGPSGGDGVGAPGLGWLFTIAGEAVGLCHDESLFVEPPYGRAIYRGENVVPIVGLPYRSTLSAYPFDAGIGIVFLRGVLGEDQMSVEPRGRPRFAHLGLDGRLFEPVTNASIETLPAEIGDRMHVSVITSDGELTMVRQDVLRRSIGTPVSLGPAPSRRWGEQMTRWSPQMSFNGNAFIVLHPTREGREWILHTSTVQCGEL